MNAQLIETQQRVEEQKERQQRELLSYSKEKRDEILNLTNTISSKKVELEAVHSHTMDVQEEVDSKTQQDSEVSMQLGQILSSICNMLARCEESFRIRHNKPPRIIDKLEGTSLEMQTDVAVSQLEEIKLFLIDFKSLKEEFVQHQRAQAAMIG